MYTFVVVISLYWNHELTTKRGRYVLPRQLFTVVNRDARLEFKCMYSLLYIEWHVAVSLGYVADNVLVTEDQWTIAVPRGRQHIGQ